MAHFFYLFRIFDTRCRASHHNVCTNVAVDTVRRLSILLSLDMDLILVLQDCAVERWKEELEKNEGKGRGSS